MLKRTIQSAFALAVLSAASQATDKPNIIVILADDIGVDCVSYEGDPTSPLTPRIDSNGYANPNCSPTRASLLTGQSAWRLGVGNPIGFGETDPVGLALTEPTIASSIDSSYRKVLLGKWHVSDVNQTGGTGSPPVAGAPPLVMGFDRFVGTWANLNVNNQSYYDWDQNTDNNPPVQKTGYITSKTIDDAILEVLLPAGDDPLLMVVALHAPHNPWEIPPANLFPSSMPTATNRDIFETMIVAMDTEIGRLVDAVAASDESDNTYIIFLGDNGTASAVIEPQFESFKAKGSAYEGGVNVPFLVTGPGVVPHVDQGLVSATDIFATVMDLSGTTVGTPPLPPSTLDSISLGAYFAGTAPSQRSVLSVETYGPNGLNPPGGERTTYKRMARDYRYKLMQTRQGGNFGLMMFDLRANYEESVNLLNGTLTVQQDDSYRALRAHLNSIGNGEYEFIP